MEHSSQMQQTDQLNQARDPFLRRRKAAGAHASPSDRHQAEKALDTRPSRAAASIV